MKKEILINFILTIITGGIIFLQNKYFIKYIGIEILGIMKLFGQLFQYLNIVEMGIGGASTFALYKPLVEKNYKKVSIIVSTIKRIYNRIAMGLLILGLLLTPTLSYFIKMESFNKIIYVYWILYVINTISSYLYIKYIILFTANQEFIYVRYVQSFSKIFYQLLQIILIIKYKSYILYILILILDNMTQYFYLKRHYKKNYSFIYSTTEKYLKLGKDVKNLFWHKLAGLIVLNTDLILISKLISIEIVGVYASYQLIIQIILTLTGVSINVIRPKIGKLISTTSVNESYDIFKKINIIFLYYSIFFSFVSYKVMNNFIILWLDKSLILTSTTIFLICINLLISIFRVVIEVFKESYGYFKDIQVPILEAVINIFFSIILGLKYGLNGIIAGTCISNIVIILGYKPILVLKFCFNKNIKEYTKLYGEYLYLISLSFIFFNKITNTFIKINITSWIAWIAYTTIISAINIGIISLIFFINRDFRQLTKLYILKKFKI